MSFNYFHSQRRPKDPRRTVILKKGYGPNWAKQKKACLERDKYTCRKCGHVGKKKSHYWDVSVHHIRKIAWFVNSRTGEVDYEKANSLDNLITLCEVNGCHRTADGHQLISGFRSLK